MWWIPLNKVKINWRKQNTTEGVISVKTGANLGSFYESGVFWNKEGNTLEAFIYTFLEACNLTTNVEVYQNLISVLHPLAI